MTLEQSTNIITDGIFASMTRSAAEHARQSIEEQDRRDAERLAESLGLIRLPGETWDAFCERIDARAAEAGRASK